MPFDAMTWGWRLTHLQVPRPLAEGKKGKVWFLWTLEQPQARFCLPVAGWTFRGELSYSVGKSRNYHMGPRILMMEHTLEFSVFISSFNDLFIWRKGTLTFLHWAKPMEGNSLEWIWILLVCTCWLLVLCLKIQNIRCFQVSNENKRILAVVLTTVDILY